MSPPRLTKPIFEHRSDGLGIGHTKPRLSWRFLASEDTTPGWTQTAYEIEVSPRVTESSRDEDSTNTFKVESGDSVLVPWPTAPLRSRQSATVRVRSLGRATDAEGTSEPTEWSEAAYVEAGLLEKDDWEAQFIGAEVQQETDGMLRPIRLWKSFELPGDVRSCRKARLYITALGVFEVLVNGKLASDECLAPGWTSYKHRLTYRTIDIGHLLKPDTHNVICIHVAEGWYAGRLGFLGGSRFWYGRDIGALAQLEFESDNGQKITVATDDTWSCSQSAILASGFYDGEIYDSSQEAEDLAMMPTEMDKVKVLPWPQVRIVATDSPPVRVVETKAAERVFKSPTGKTLIDFGQNLTGKLQIKSFKLERGAKLVLKHAEVLEHGELGTRPLRVAKCTDTVIGSGRELRDWTPTFTFRGFRYVEVEGWQGGEMPGKDDFVALVMHSDFKRRGRFHCSNSHVNKLHENVVWSMKGNFLSIPTDCPQRDERMGWTGDLQVFAPTASFLYDTSAFLTSWLEDISDEQLEDGRGGVPPLVVPDVLPDRWPRMPQAVWDDATILTPWDLYQAHGDTALLEKQFSSMQAWLNEGVERGSDGLWTFDRWQLGDWLDPKAPPDNAADSPTDSILVSDAYLVHVTNTMRKVCERLGKTESVGKYSNEHDRLRSRFQHKYISPAGNLMSNTQTGISLAVQFGLYRNADQLKVASASLDKLVRSARFRISTGFAGTPLITHALTNIGQPQLAYRMLLEKSCPSWMYPITMGATTIWERWDSMLPNGSVNPGEMTSFNHYALGAVANWLHSTVGGLSPLEPGWRTILVRPIPGGNLTSAETEFDGPYGQIICTWKWQSHLNGKFEMDLTVPPNSKAVVILPSVWKSAGSVSSIPTDAVFVNSGHHVFSDKFQAGSWPPAKFDPMGWDTSESDIAT